MPEFYSPSEEESIDPEKKQPFAEEEHKHNHDHLHEHAHGHKHHSHSHGHHHHSGSAKRLAIAFALTAGFMVVEFIGGLLTGSLALLADAGHMVTDAASLGLGLFAAWISIRTSPNKTFGYKRVEILAAFINGLALFLLSFFIVTEALERFAAPQEIETGTMLIIAVLGLIINLVAVGVLFGGSGENLNVKSALLHVAGDTLGSVAAIGAAIIMFFTGLYIVDALASILLTVLILWSAWGIIRDSTNILILGKPPNINIDEVRTAMKQIQGVSSIHDLHIFEITQNMPSLTAHIKLEDDTDSHELPTIRKELQTLIKERFHIDHSTIQLEIDFCDQENPCGPPKCNECEEKECNDCPWAERWEKAACIDE
ncbi:MAG: cation diffusion facilitator family transporter [Candidatus Hermodarchaeota archaeon]